MEARHQTLLDEARARIQEAADADELRRVERSYLDKDGVVAGLLAEVPRIPAEQRPAAGRAANDLKRAVQALVDEARAALDALALAAARAGGDFDPTLPGRSAERGSLHPLTQVTRELEDLFRSMGFAVLDGPEVELEHYNFEALNIPADHPARDSHDTFYCELPSAPPSAGDAAAGPGPQLVLRTHTSPVQVRAMERLHPPLRAIAPGKVFRQETTDASHEHTFHQMEGIVVDRGVSVGHLIGTMKTFLRGIFGRELEVRLRPGYFPFVEPGFELDVRCPFCADRVAKDRQAACSVCKATRWIELCPCGMVHPNVLRSSGVDPEEYSGFAFGLGLSRLVMVRHGIDDVRHLLSGDLRFLEQFRC